MTVVFAKAEISATARGDHDYSPPSENASAALVSLLNPIRTSSSDIENIPKKRRKLNNGQDVSFGAPGANLNRQSILLSKLSIDLVRSRYPSLSIRILED